MLLTTTTAWATITGSGTSTDPYVINNVSDWNTAAQNSTYNSAGVYVALGADLDFGNSASNSKRYGWRVTPANSYATTCKMHFDGKGHTISRFYVDSSDSYVALFTELGQSGTITNLTVASSTLVGNQWVGGIVGRNMGTVSNCHVESTVTIRANKTTSKYCGGIAGQNGYHLSTTGNVTGTVTNCTVGAKFELYANTANNLSFGGIVGYNYNASTVSGCLCYSTNVTSGTTFKSLIGNYNNESIITNNYYRPVGSYGHGAPSATVVRAVGGIPEGVTSPAICVSHGGYAYIAQNTTFTLSTPAYKAFNNDFSVSGTGASFTLAGNKTSATVTIGSNDATVNASLRNFTYTVVFNGNNKTSGSMSNQAFEYSVSQNLTTNAFSRTGYTYAGWNTQTNGSGTSYTDGQSVSNLTTTDGGTVTLYAQWTAHHYSVRFNGNGNTSGSMSNQGFTYDVAQNLTNNAFSRAFTVTYNYNGATGGNNSATATATATFNGWATSVGGSKVYNNQQSVSNLTATNNGIVDLYANWTDGSVTLPTPTKTGYTFAGWYSDEGLTVKVGDAGASYTPSANKTLYAKWTVHHYTVQFNNNASDATGSMNNQGFTYDAAQNLTANAFTRTGYDFAGWNTLADGSGTSYADKASVSNLTATDDATVILYAQWTAHTYTVHFDGNGSTSGSMSDQGFTYDVAQKLTANGFSRAFTVNYEYNEATGGNDVASVTTTSTYNGWATTADGAVVYTDQQSVSNLTPTNNGIVDLYAKWTDGSVTLPTPTKTGYTFAGWYSDEGLATKVGDAGASYTPSASITLYAKWTANHYTVHFDGNGSTDGSMTDQGFTYDEAQELTDNGFTRTHYDFVGWNTQANGSGTSYTNQQSVSNLTPTNNAIVTLYAQWTPHTYTITYNLDGGSVATANPTSYTVETATITLNNPTKLGYTFLGWYDNPGFNGEAVTTIDYGSTGNKTLYAQWTLITYTIAYDLNGGSVATANPTTYNVETETFTLNNPTKPGYTFTGWTGSNGETPATTVTIEKGSTENRTYTANYEITHFTEGDLSYECTSGTEVKVTACNSSATSVTIPATVSNDNVTYNVTAINADAFSSYTSLLALILNPATPPSLGSNALDDCTALNAIGVPAGTAGAYKEATNWAAYSTKIFAIDGTCGANVYYSYDSSTTTLRFFGTGGMTDYSALEAVPWYSYLANIATVVIGNGVTGIGARAFKDCTGLASVTIPASVTSIDDYAFSGSGLTSVTIPNSMTSIGYSAFSDCTSLTSIEIPASVTSIGYGIFSGCNDLTSISVASGNSTYHSDGNCIIETATKTLIQGCKTSVIPTGVMGIGNYAFGNFTGLTSVDIPDGVTSICDNAFSGCDALTSVTIPNSVTSIGGSAFYGCTGLTSVTIPASVTSISDNAFLDCTSLASVTIYAPSPLGYGKAFGGNAEGRKIYVPSDYIDNYKNDYDWKRYGYADVTEPIIDGSCGTGVYYSYNSISKTLSIFGIGAMTSHPWTVLSYSGELTTVVVSDGVTSICDNAFAGCSSLASVFIDAAALTTYGTDAFSGNASGREIYVPTASVADYKTGWNAYSGDIVGFDGSCGANVYYSYDSTSKTLSIFGTGGMRDYDYSEDYDYSVDVPWYSERENITKVVIGDGVTSIGGLAFAYSTALTSVTIPTSVTSICDNAFHGCTSLTSVEIPANVTSIDGTAFMGCTSLASVTIYAPSPVGYRMAFENNAKGRKIYVFSDCIDDYKNDDDWITYGYADATEPITLTANEGDKSGEYWTTYYNELANAKVSSGAQAFKVTLSGTTLALTEINDGIISRGEAVVIKSTSANVQPEYSATESSDTKENDLKGTMTSITNPGNAYVLNKTNENGVGFYKLSTSGTIGAHKAYLTYDGALAREIFAFDEATGISRPTPGPSLNGGEWYDLSGRKLDGKPTKKGIYVNKGHKVVVK